MSQYPTPCFSICLEKKVFVELLPLKSHAARLRNWSGHSSHNSGANAQLHLYESPEEDFRAKGDER